MSTQTFFPIFADNQVLTSSQLNELRNFLDEENRLTRVNLIGMGVGAGLDVSANLRGPALVSISCGTGVTSEGYLITLGDCTTDRYRPYTLPVGTIYAPFMDNASTQDVALYEMLTTTSPSDPMEVMYDPTFLSDKVVLLFIEFADIEFDSCLGRKCDENGLERSVTLRKLLVSKLDYDNKILPRTYGTLPDPLFEAKYSLSDIFMRRVLFDPAQPPSQTYMDFSAAYANAFRTDIFPNLIAQLNLTYTVYQPILEPLYSENPFQEADILTSINTWMSYLNGTQIGSAPPYFGIQYFYDFVKDLILAYDEFCKSAFELASMCCMNSVLFPRHLALGEATGNGECGPTPYRQEFIFSRVQEGQKPLLDRTLMLHKRIVLMLRSFEFDLINNPTPANVITYATPSFEKRSMLSDRAIPYYYDINNTFPYNLFGGILYDTLSRNWNFDLVRKCRTENGIVQVLAYDNQDPNQLSDQGPIKTPLYYNLDPYNFFLIEGVLRKNYVTALNEVNTIRTRFDLPFNVIALRLQGEPFDAIEDRCNFEDLRTQYSTVRSQLQCMAAEICSRVNLEINQSSFINSFINDANSVTGNTSVAFNPTPLVLQIAPGAEVLINSGLGGSVLPPLDPGKTVIGVDTNVLDPVPITDKNTNTVSTDTNNYKTVTTDPAKSPVKTIDTAEPVTIGGLLGTTLTTIDANINVSFGTVIQDKESPLEILVDDFNLAMTNYCNKMQELTDDQLLPFDFKSFNYGADITNVADSFIKTYIDAMNMAISAKVSSNRIFDYILRNSKTRPTPEMYFLLSQYAAELMNVFDNFLESCIYKEFETLYYTYRYRLQWLHDNDPTLFSNFIKKHPGPEHMRGVPKGGTFIMVYNGDNISVSVNSIQEANLVAQNIENLRCQEQVLMTKPSKSRAEVLLLASIQAQLAECFELNASIGRPFTPLPIQIQQFQLLQDQVIADFALPYLCCCDCDCGEIPAPTEADLALPNIVMPTYVRYLPGDYAFGVPINASAEGCNNKVTKVNIDVKSQAIYNRAAGTTFRLKFIKNGIIQEPDTTPDSNGAYDTITTARGGFVELIRSGTTYLFRYSPSINIVGMDTFDYIFEVYSRLGKQLSSTPGRVYVDVTCDCTVVPINNQSQQNNNTSNL